MDQSTHNKIVSFIWGIADDVLRDLFKRGKYPDYFKRKKIKAILDTYIPEFSVRIGGSTSIDITKPGIDKAYGIGKLRDLLHISLQEMIYIGDALFPGGNDYAAEKAGVDCIPVEGPEETKHVIKTIIACLADRGQAA